MSIPRCPCCGGAVKRHGTTHKGSQRWACKSCHKTTTRITDTGYRGRIGERKERDIQTLLENGLSVRKVADTVGVSRTTVTSRRAALLEKQIAKPVAQRPNMCHYCGKHLLGPREFQRSKARTRHQFCDNECYQRFQLATNPERLVNYLYRMVKFNVH
jgi:transposase-like protein